jgi:hypothetical protein
VSGYVLDYSGGIHPFGAAPPLNSGPTWPGWDVAVTCALGPGSPAGSSGRKVDAYGQVHPFGAA